MKKLLILFAAAMAIGAANAAPKRKAAPQTDREYWAALAYKISKPILEPMSRGQLQAEMPMEYSPIWDNRDKEVAWMEAFGRLMAGIAPWIALPDDGTAEGKMRTELKGWALKSYANAVNPASGDYLGWDARAMQTIVDASYLATSFIRAPKELWEPLDQITKDRYVAEFKKLRRNPSFHSNWILFRVIIEAFMAVAGEEVDGFAARMGVSKINDWYVGDGLYSDGEEFSMDYYNSFVLNPMMVESTEVFKAHRIASPVSFDLALRRMQRYNEILERFIAPDGTFPIVGRSMTYRMACFQALALAAWKYGLPSKLTNGGVRSALTAVMKNMFVDGRNFNAAGYLTFGFSGMQPEITDYYTNTGSLYITSLVFMPLGLPADAPFWSDPAERWTSQRAWAGESFPKDGHQSIMK